MREMFEKLKFTIDGERYSCQQLSSNNFIVGDRSVTVEAVGVENFQVRHSYSGHIEADLPTRQLKGRRAFRLELLRGRNLLHLEPGGIELSLFWKSSLRDWTESILKAFVILLVIQTFVVQTFFIPTGSMKNTLFPGDYIMVEKLTYRFHSPDPGEIIVFEFPDDISKDFIKRLIAKGGDTLVVNGGVVKRNGEKMTEKYTVFKKRLADPRLQAEGSGIDFDLRLPPRWRRAPGAQNSYRVELNSRLAAIPDLDVDSLEQAETRLKRMKSPEEVEQRAGSYHFDSGKLALTVHPRGSVSLNSVARRMEAYFRFSHADTVRINGLEREVFGETAQFERRPVELDQDVLWAMGDNRNNSADSRFWRRPLRGRGVMGKALLVYWPPQNMGMIHHEHLDRRASTP